MKMKERACVYFGTECKTLSKFYSDRLVLNMRIGLEFRILSVKRIAQPCASLVCPTS